MFGSALIYYYSKRMQQVIRNVVINVNAVAYKPEKREKCILVIYKCHTVAVIDLLARIGSFIINAGMFWYG